MRPSLIGPEVGPARLVVREPRGDEYRERLDDRSARDPGELGEPRHLGVAIDGRDQRSDALGHHRTVVPVAHERAPETGVVHDGEIRTELHSRSFVERVLDLAQPRLIAHDLPSHVRQAQLVEPGLAHGRVPEAMLPLDEIPGLRAYAAVNGLEGAAPDEIPIIIAPLDELVLREHPRTQLRRERRNDVGGKVAQRTLPLQEDVREPHVGPLAHGDSEDVLLVHDATQLFARQYEGRARRVGDHRGRHLLLVEEHELADERWGAHDGEGPELDGPDDTHRAVDDHVGLVERMALVDQHLADVELSLRRELFQTLAGGFLEQRERSERERVRQLAHSARGSAAPMMSRIDASPSARTYAARPSITVSGAVGSANVAVPTCTADAPAMRNSSASFAFVTPPAPMIGIDTACATWSGRCTAMGRSAGAARPPR